jgi:hypothetical protein
MTDDTAPSHPRTRVSRERSTIKFPYDDLSSAESIVRAVHNGYGGQATSEQIAAELRVSSRSGAFRNKISAARMFGFVLVDRQGGVTPTDLGKRLLDSRTAADAKADGFMNVPLYAELYRRLHNATLPSDKGIESLIRDLGVAAKQVPTARQAFQRSADQAGYFHQGRDRLVTPPRGRVEEAGLPEEPGVAQRREEGQPGMQADPLLASLFQKLPPKDQGFSKTQQDNFITALKAIFPLVYGSDDEEHKDGGEETESQRSVRQSVEQMDARTPPSEEDAPSATSSPAGLRAS